MSLSTKSKHSSKGNMLAVAIMALSILASSGGTLLDTMPASSAYADDMEELEAAVATTGAAYDEAVAHQESIQNDIAETQKRVDELEAALPGLQEKARRASVTMYKENGDLQFLWELILDSNSMSDALYRLEQYEKFLEYQTTQVSNAKNARAELGEQRNKLEADMAAAQVAVEQAENALEEAKAARQAAQEEAEARAAAQAAQAAAADASALAADINWNMSKSEFVSHWGSRIDAYLSGSPLSGYGELFAESAWTYGVDPRWSPAISLVESGKGSVCFRSYNAWGWMGHSFSSWEEAIPAHVEYLSSSLYGGYLTMSGAATYCPPGDSWYSKCAAEMRSM